jgi:hypothetical protein
MKENLPKRKATRLHNFDYGSTGAYFITVCVRDRMKILSDVVTDTNGAPDSKSVGEGLGPPVNEQYKIASPQQDWGAVSIVGEGLGLPEVRLTQIGEIVEEQLLLLEDRYSNLIVDEYVIMPDHIHVLFMLRKTAGGASPSPTGKTRSVT